MVAPKRKAAHKEHRMSALVKDGLPWLTIASELTLAVSVLLLLPLSFFRGTRHFACFALLIASWVLAAVVWLWSLILTYSIWGWLGVIIGIFLAGVGVVPVALVATLIKGFWSLFWELSFMVAFIFGMRAYSVYLAAKIDRASSAGNTA
jgi:hypothetical protein